MRIFDILMEIFLIGTSIFYLIFFYLCVIWSNQKHPEESIKIGFLISTYYTFLVFLAGTGCLAIIFLLIKFYPDLIKLFSNLISL